MIRLIQQGAQELIACVNAQLMLVLFNSSLFSVNNSFIDIMITNFAH